LPVERYFDAKQRLRRMPVYSSRLRQFVAAAATAKDAARERAISLGQWTPLGPGNIGGRTRVLVINPRDPNLMYTAGVAGGIWKSIDGGGSWFPLGDLLPNLAVVTLAMDPENPDILYAGTGENFSNADGVRGAGIFKTVDGGASWERLESTTNFEFFFVSKIEVSRVDSRRVYAAARGGVWRSLDSGITWRRVLDRGAPALGCGDMILRAEGESDFVVASCRANPQGAIWRNRAAELDAPWELVFTAEHMQRTSLAFAPSRPSVIYAMATSSEPGTCPDNPGSQPVTPCYRGGLLGVYRSMENGDAGTWETRTSNADENRLNTVLLSNPRSFFADICRGGPKTFSSQGNYDNVIAVDPLDHEIVWAGGIDLFRSNDGGANWGIASYWWLDPSNPAYAHADHHFIAFHPNYDGEANQRMYITTDGGLHRTDNARAEVASGETAPCTAASLRVRWTSLNNNYSVTQFYHGSVYPGGHLQFGGAQDNGTNRGAEVDGPNRWLELRGGDGGYTAVNPTNPNVLFVSTQRLALVRSANGGRTVANATAGINETSTNFAFIVPYRMDPSDPQRLWLGGRSLWRTADEGRRWTRASRELLAAGSISAVAIAPTDPNRVLAGSSDGRIFRNLAAVDSDESSEWTPARPRTGAVSWIEFDPENSEIAYATYSNFNTAPGDRHVYKTEDGGATWFPIDGVGDTGIPDIPVHTILPDPFRPLTLYLGTDLGIFVSTDGGGTWAKEDSGFPNTVVQSMSIQKAGEGSVLHAFTYGRGVWKVWLGPGEPCRYELNAERVQAPLSGGLVAVTVTTGEGCPWSVLAPPSWISLPETAVGVGSGRVELRVTGPTGSTRETVVYIADKALTVVQSAN
jgi:photosystem II stability/assembly factor-like uncharacterized protein